MKQQEIDEISDAYISAWEEYFGDVMYYVTFDATKTQPDTLYREKKTKVYDFDSKLTFHGTLKESSVVDEEHQSGKRIIKQYEITFITKELADQGITEINTNDIIQYIDRFGKEHLYKIYDTYQKVQFSNNKIFTSLLVIPKEETYS